jgi:hypothetical protein
MEGQWADTPILSRVTLPNLRWLGFQGASAFLEAFLPQVTIPLFEKFQIYLEDRHTYAIQTLHQFINTLGNLQFNTTTLVFLNDYVNVMGYPHKGAKMYNLCVSYGASNFDWQVRSIAQVCHMIRTIFSAVEHLSLEYDRHFIYPSWNCEPDRSQWRELLRSFGSAKTLYVDGELVEQLSRVLQPGEGESSLELLPELQELSYPAIASSLDVFTPFIDARRRAGRSVTTVHTSFEGITGLGCVSKCSTIVRTTTHTPASFDFC